MKKGARACPTHARFNRPAGNKKDGDKYATGRSGRRAAGRKAPTGRLARVGLPVGACRPASGGGGGRSAGVYRQAHHRGPACRRLAVGPRRRRRPVGRRLQPGACSQAPAARRLQPGALQPGALQRACWWTARAVHHQARTVHHQARTVHHARARAGTHACAQARGAAEERQSQRPTAKRRIFLTHAALFRRSVLVATGVGEKKITTRPAAKPQPGLQPSGCERLAVW